ncbi:Transcriptional regulator, AsnC family [Pseudonocardia sp. Ae406_Ps2]|uniref:Lrp/AsnC family transcriptional regulator n=1 Tax=unclassified Pseudonocardia TaxID=2619320 RepID=UPI0002F737E6|nr:Transcriptional regulator, AsnC family [Pseudonocardia sp. Ae331_Ps2]OLM04459.1 Transcriptional regulator, AsnC family [Pseudonocardia sp. Ae406_Ps2]OLM26021.1 Transcriptional regulator, AsnC family [Pseudonocardia sp. Ae706_Ps2]OLM33854.1 Transcriptional regulator, AsnC family [Pseudonocardia sp. Ae717_Ps2]
MDGIDAIDRRLLDLLRVDGRASWADLGGRVGLSASAVRRRVDRLTARGVVQGFTVQVDPDAERTPGVAAYVELFCRGTVAPAELQRMLSAVPEVVTAGTVTGEADALVLLRSRDVQSLEDALERLRLAANVDHTRSAVVLTWLVTR